MGKSILFEESRKGLLEGARKIAKAVGSTLGPFGRNVIIKKEYSTPHVTKDGVTVADHIRFEDQLEDMGAIMIREAARKTANRAGDGTSSTTVLAYAFIKNYYEQAALQKMPSIRETRNIITERVNEFKEFVKEEVINVDPLKMIKEVGLIATNGDEEMSDMVQACYKELGPHSDIIIDTAPGVESTFETFRGMHFEGGYKAKEFLTNPERDLVEMDKCLILITDKKITEEEELYHIAKKVIGAKFSLLIIAPEVSGEAMHMVVNTAIRYPGKICVIKSPGMNVRRSEMLEDIAVYTGGKVLKENTGLTLNQQVEGLPIKDFMGSADKIIVRNQSTTIKSSGGSQDKIDSRVAYIQAKMEEQGDVIMKERFDKRISGLTSGVAAIYVGAGSEIEVKEKKDRLDDCIRAVKSSLEMGIVYGGGSIYVKFAEQMNIKNPIDKVLVTSLYSILHTIWINNGEYESIPFTPYSKYAEYLKENNILDPAKVVSEVVENALSVGYSIISTSTTIINDAKSNEMLGDLPNFDDIGRR